MGVMGNLFIGSLVTFLVFMLLILAVVITLAVIEGIFEVEVIKKFKNLLKIKPNKERELKKELKKQRKKMKSAENLSQIEIEIEILKAANENYKNQVKEEVEKIKKGE